MKAEVLQRLCGLLGIDPKLVAVEPLRGGLSNRTFRLLHGSSSWVVRVPSGRRKRDPHALDLVCEERVLRAAAEARLAPAVVFRDPVTGALVTACIEGAAPWSAGDARSPENIPRIAAVLRALHSMKACPELTPFRPVSLSEWYLASAHGSRAGAFSAEEQRWERELRSLALVYETHFRPAAICHHDLVAANILEDDTLWLVDFEYARRAHPISDLASLAGMNGYDASRLDLLVETYFGDDPVPFGRNQLDEMVRLERLLSYFWAVFRKSTTAPQQDMEAFADSIGVMLR